MVSIEEALEGIDIKMLKGKTDDQIEHFFHDIWKDADIQTLNDRIGKILDEFKVIGKREQILHKEAYMIKILINRYIQNT